MAGLRIAALSKRYGAVTALAPLDLSIADGELVCVLGPSGCGKSTLLRLIAGLEVPSSGALHLGERRIDALPAPQRDVAMVFQSYALYPHYTVAGNIEFPLRMRGMPVGERRSQVAEVADLLDIAPLLDRRPAQLSGGQRQRVALARALVRRPALFLLDEPLSNVDARLREQLRRYIGALQRRLRVTMLYVTHDHNEAMALGDRIAVFEDGRLLQVGTPLEVFERPASRAVAELIGTPPMNLLPATYDGTSLQIGTATVPLSRDLRDHLGRTARALVIGLRPEAFAPSAEGSGLRASVDPARIERLGSETLLAAEIGGLPVRARLPGSSPTVPVYIAAAFEALHLFDAGSGERITG